MEEKATADSIYNNLFEAWKILFTTIQLHSDFFSESELLKLKAAENFLSILQDDCDDPPYLS